MPCAPLGGLTPQTLPSWTTKSLALQLNWLRKLGTSTGGWASPWMQPAKGARTSHTTHGAGEGHRYGDQPVLGHHPPILVKPAGAQPKGHESGCPPPAVPRCEGLHAGASSKPRRRPGRVMSTRKRGCAGLASGRGSGPEGTYLPPHRTEGSLCLETRYSSGVLKSLFLSPWLFMQLFDL